MKPYKYPFKINNQWFYLINRCEWCCVMKTMRRMKNNGNSTLFIVHQTKLIFKLNSTTKIKLNKLIDMWAVLLLSHNKTYTNYIENIDLKKIIKLLHKMRGRATSLLWIAMKIDFCCFKSWGASGKYVSFTFSIFFFILMLRQAEHRRIFKH